MLRQLANLSDSHWCVIGDFNDLMSSDDKRGLHDHPNWCIHGFRATVSDAGLVDLQLNGYPFTWWKSRGSMREVEERLDRAMVNQQWLFLYPDARLDNLVAPISGHSPILLTCEHIPPKLYL